jgi:L-asparagine transporter-like permease
MGFVIIAGSYAPFGLGAIFPGVTSVVFTLVGAEIATVGGVMLFVYLILALAQIVNRRGLEATQPDRLRLKIWCFPWLSYSVVVAIAVILVATAFTKGLASQFNASAGSLAIALVAYILRRHSKPPSRLVPQTSATSDARSE